MSSSFFEVRAALARVAGSREPDPGVEQAVDAMVRAFEASSEGVVVLDERHEVQFANQRAQRQLASWFGWRATERRVPAQIGAWLSCPLDAHEPVAPLHAARGGFELTVTLLAGADQEAPVLLLTESGAELAGPVVASAGLTQREIEVLRSVAAGLADRDIARELGMSVRTVQKHLQHSYAKLGVTSRTEAIARIVPTIGQDP